MRRNAGGRGLNLIEERVYRQKTKFIPDIISLLVRRKVIQMY
jgi:hypothetical protein